MKNFKVYKSSAGSGKTYTLVKEFLLLSLKDSNPYAFTKILAITFTNKAATEMKERILKALKEIGGNIAEEGTSYYLKEDLKKELEIKEEELQVRCQKAHLTILHNYADFNVSTIDKFSHRLLRTFAKDLDLSVNFKVDLDEDTILRQVIGLMISVVGQDPQISDLVINHSLTKVEEGDSWNPIEDIFEVAKKLLAEDGALRLAQMSELKIEKIKEIQQTIWKENKVYEQKISGIGEAALNLIKSNSINSESFRYGNKNGGGLPSYYKKLVSFDYKSFKPTQRVLETIEEDKWFSGKVNSTDKLAIDNIKSQLIDYYNLAQEEIKAGLAIYLSKKLISKNLRLVALLKAIESRLSTLKKEQRIVPISDFNKKISEVVLNEPMPFVYEKLGEKYDHIMIDEFQDTSILQFMNLMPLIEESLARGEFNMIVGDAKQAIYRFRGGEVEQFSEMPDYVPEQFSDNPIVINRLLSLKSQYNPDNLIKNYRSKAKIVAFNNELFENLKTLMPARVLNIFDGHRQEYDENDNTGFVDVKFFKHEDKKFNYMKQVFSDIQDCIKDGYSHEDIAILCRTRNHAIEISEFLKVNDIPILSSESLRLITMPHILFLIDMALWINEPDNKNYQKNCIEFLVKTKRIHGELDERFQKMILNNESFENNLKQLGYQVDVTEHRAKTSYECFESLIRIFKLNEGFDIYLQFFMEAVLNFSQSESKSLMDFLRWWEIKGDKLSIEAPEGMDAVQVLTIHKSKGLEFPIVIYPFAEQSISEGKHVDLLWVKQREYPELASNTLVEYGSDMFNSTYTKEFEIEYEKKFMDLVNDTYVAFTRPTDRLYIRTKKPSAQKSLDELENYNLARLLEIGRPINATINDEGYSIGLASKKTTAVKMETAIDFDLHYHSEAWDNKLKLGQNSKHELNEDELNAQRFGNLFHEIMSKIDKAEDIDEVVNQYFLNGQLTKEQKKILTEEINSILLSEDCAPFFSNNKQTLNEATLIEKNGKVWRPDRVVFNSDKIMVLEYKTGEEKEAHKKQVQNYMNLITAMSEKQIEGYLYYLEDKKLEQVFN
ncbi:MAG: Dna2/Cas4 domain-containing protein [Bacteroidetes bacterium]|nr:MAG: Dna2/Cas4 domain-containing protein [Bacteroidota bacterium]MBL1145999.1 Dna2/Cas4 domain-containing protein [Bacteroidota bacterium]NOG58793.1 UvrD-helicase domain-containing protein [Bacteroidota bacterium]